jgi:hypothetical protein
MLDSIYTAIFRPFQIRFPRQAAVAIGLLATFIMASNAAARTNSGIGGLLGFALLFLFAGTLGWYWLAASVNLIAQLLEGQGNARATLEGTAWGLWPLLFTGVAVAAANWSALLGQLFLLIIVIGVFVTLTIAIRQVHQFSWLKAIFCLSLTLIFSLLALSGLLLWPVMIFLGI